MAKAFEIKKTSMPGRWRTAFYLAKKLAPMGRAGQRTTIDFRGRSILVNGELAPVHFPFIEKLSGLSIAIVPTPQFTRPSTFIDYYNTVNLILKGVYYKDVGVLKNGLRQHGLENRAISRDVASVRLPQAYAEQQIVGLLENHNIYQSADGFNIFLYLATKTWDHSLSFNTYDRLLNTVRAFMGKSPTELDTLSAKKGYTAEAEHDLKYIYRSKSRQEKFIEFASQYPRDITFSSRYLPIADILGNYLSGHGLLSHPLVRSFGNVPDIRYSGAVGGKPKVRILEVGGAPFSLKEGSPAIRNMLSVLKERVPNISFEVTVTDINFPEEFGIRGPQDKPVRDPKFSEISYSYHDVTTNNMHDYDIVLCSRVLTQRAFDANGSGDVRSFIKRIFPFLSKEWQNYRAARENTYGALKPGGILFLDQGRSPFMEIWMKQEGSINRDRYLGLLNRIDHWFHEEQLQIFGDHESYLLKFLKGRTIPLERRIIAQYYPVFSEPTHNRIDANLLWKICMPNRQIDITEDIKEVFLPEFLRRLSKKDPRVRTHLGAYLHSLSNRDEVDLKDAEGLDRILADYGVPFSVDRVKLMETKLGETGLDRLIPRAVRRLAHMGSLPRKNFSELGGVITRVEHGVEVVRCRVKFMTWDPHREFEVIIPEKRESERYQLEQILAVDVK